MKPFLRCVLFFLVLTGFIVPPSVCGSGDGFGSRFVRQMEFRRQLNEERLYLHLDRPRYLTGETIRFKGYLLNGSNLRNESPSNYLYVELFDRYDSLLIRKKFRRDADSSGFTGELTLPVSLSSGEYTLRSYTQWMRNFGPEVFYRRSLTVGSAFEREISSRIRFEREEGGKLTAEIRFCDSLNRPFRGAKVMCRINDTEGDPRTVKVLTTDEVGRVFFRLDPDEILRDRIKPAIEVHFRTEAYQCDRKFYIPSQRDDYEVTFFPEGGDLLSGVSQKVAFKAQHESGFPDSVVGTVLNQRGDTMARFETLHDGMGVFLLRGEPGERYRAETRSVKGVAKSFQLPEVCDDGVSLSLSQNGSRILYRLDTGRHTLVPDTLYLAAYRQDRAECLLQLTGGTRSGVIPTDGFAEGVSRFVVSDASGQTLSRRLLYIRREDSVSVSVVPAKAVYGKREQCLAEVALQSSDGSPVGGVYSVSVTDASVVPPDSSAGNIRTQLLLTGDLKGYLSDPDYYFRGNDRLRSYHLDLVMLTHGWSRYDTDNVLSDSLPAFIYPVEPVQYVSGRVLTMLNAPARRSLVCLLGTRDSLAVTTQTDGEGRFLMAPLDYRDSTRFMLRAANLKNKNAFFEILPDEESVAPVSGMPPAPAPGVGFAKLVDAYLDDVRDRVADSSGISSIYLREVTVTANADKSHLLRSNEEIVDKYSVSIDPRSLIRPKRKTVLDALLAIDGMVLYPQAISYLTRSRIWYMNHFTKVFVNDIAIDIDQEEVLENIPVEDIRSVNIHRAMLKLAVPTGSMTIAKCSGNWEYYANIEFDESVGLVSGHTLAMDPETHYHNIVTIELKSNYSFDKRPRKWFARVSSLGYTQPTAVYQPVYDTPASRMGGSDRRPLLYWNPSLAVDSAGRGEIGFYTSDRPENYRVEIEGVTPGGRIVRYAGDLRRPE